MYRIAYGVAIRAFLCSLLGLFLEQVPATAQLAGGQCLEFDDASSDGSTAPAHLEDPKPFPELRGLPATDPYAPHKDIPSYKPLDSARSWDGSSIHSDAIAPVEPARTHGRVQWKQAILQSVYYTGIMHTFNVTTEAGTRDTLNGHWFRNYIDSVGELRGWSDSDTFMAPYVGHPLEGSIFGYIFRQNDPKYRNVQ